MSDALLVTATFNVPSGNWLTITSPSKFTFKPPVTELLLSSVRVSWGISGGIGSTVSGVSNLKSDNETAFVPAPICCWLPVYKYSFSSVFSIVLNMFIVPVKVV